MADRGCTRDCGSGAGWYAGCPSLPVLSAMLCTSPLAVAAPPLAAGDAANSDELPYGFESSVAVRPSGWLAGSAPNEVPVLVPNAPVPSDGSNDVPVVAPPKREPPSAGAPWPAGLPKPPSVDVPVVVGKRLPPPAVPPRLKPPVVPAAPVAPPRPSDGVPKGAAPVPAPAGWPNAPVPRPVPAVVPAPPKRPPVVAPVPVPPSVLPNALGCVLPNPAVAPGVPKPPKPVVAGRAVVVPALPNGWNGLPRPVPVVPAGRGEPNAVDPAAGVWPKPPNPVVPVPVVVPRPPKPVVVGVPKAPVVPAAAGWPNADVADDGRRATQSGSAAVSDRAEPVWPESVHASRTAGGHAEPGGGGLLTKGTAGAGLAKEAGLLARLLLLLLLLLAQAAERRATCGWW